MTDVTNEPVEVVIDPTEVVSVEITEYNAPVRLDSPLDSPENVTVPVEPTVDTPTLTVVTVEPDERNIGERIRDALNAGADATGNYLYGTSLAQRVTAQPAIGLFIVFALLGALILLAALLA